MESMKELTFQDSIQGGEMKKDKWLEERPLTIRPE
jgi:hypothetical protein